MTIFGITGQTGAGKTTVLEMLETMDCELIDCDAVYRDILSEDLQLQEELEGIFGDLRDDTGKIDRKKLGALVFADATLLLQLNAITHPYVLKKVDENIKTAQKKGRKCVAIDAISLIESGLSQRCHFVFAVVASEEKRLARICTRDHISEEYAIQRVKAQKTQDFFEENCNAVIKNDFDRVEDFILYVKDFFIKYI